MLPTQEVETKEEEWTEEGEWADDVEVEKESLKKNESLPCSISRSGLSPEVAAHLPTQEVKHKEEEEWKQEG